MKKIVLNTYIKRKKIINVIKNNKIRILNKNLMLDILDDGKLDLLIKNITNDKIMVIKSPLVPKGYLTGYEQFVSILDNFISYALNYINSSELIKEIIVRCLSENQILLSKKYFYDPENIEYYKYNFNLSISRIFYNNLIKLNNSLEEELSIINININNKKDISYLTRFLDEIIFINRNDYKILSLFTPIDDKKYDLYLNWYKMLLTKYINNIDFIKIYREYKNSN